MKKYNKIKYVLVIAIPLFVISCRDLERFPYDSIATEQSFEKASDAQKWDNGLYSYFRGRQYGIYTYTTDVQADQLNAANDFGNRNGSPYRWTDFLAGDYSIRDVWAGYYSAIANLNKMIEGINTIQPEDSDDEDIIKQCKGDAFLARAYYYQQLIIRWAKDYDASTASEDLGVPLVLTFDVYAQPSRASIEEVYSQILSDIDSAGILLSGIPGEQGAIKFNEDVVLAQKARTMLYMKNWEQAEKAADELINSGTYELFNSVAGLKKMWKNDDPQEVIFQSYVTASHDGELGHANSIYLGYNPGDDQTQPYYDPDFVPAKWVVETYSDNDIRKEVYFKDTSVKISGVDYNDIYIVNKYPGNPELFTTSVTNYQQTPKVFRIAEMYLISAEAAFHQSGKESKARETLNELRTNRGLSKLVGTTGNDLLDSIKIGRFRELAFEGFRLDDLKRWHEGFTRHDPQNTAFLLEAGGDGYTKSVPADADKFIWGIPTRDVTVNPNLKDEQNPGW